MRKRFLLIALLFLCCGVCLWTASVNAAAAKKPTVAVILLGSLEYQQRDYYEIAYETLQKRFPDTNYKLVIGDHPQYMFNRFSDKQGLTPGTIPSEELLADFAWTHSFDRVLFLLLTAPNIKSNEVTIQWENAEVTMTARALSFDSRQKKKLSDALTTQTVKMYNRIAAKRAVFQKALETLRDQIILS
jgi:hypothetical protein